MVLDDDERCVHSPKPSLFQHMLELTSGHTKNSPRSLAVPWCRYVVMYAMQTDKAEVRRPTESNPRQVL